MWHAGICGLAICFLVLAGCEAIWTLLRDDRRPHRYLIPEGFVGWVRIDYEIEGTSELPIKDGFRVYRVPATGYLETSSQHEEGWASDEYYYIHADGKLEPIPASAPNLDGLIWRRIIGGVDKPGEENLTFTQFFVGPEELARRSPNRGDDGEPLYGQVSLAKPR